jgi:hypothetical protein
MREIAVKASSQRKDSDNISYRERQYCNPAETSEKDTKREQVHNENGRRSHQ